MKNITKNIIIMGAAGRDFHNYLTLFNNKNYNVKAFTATQIPDIEKRIFPKQLTHNKKSIPIYPEEQIRELIKKLKIQEVHLCYSDLSNDDVMHKAATVNAAGADFILDNPKATMLKSKKPIIAVVAVRTGCGKSQTSMKIADYIKSKKKKVIIIRHPMPYGDLVKQEVQRFQTKEDLIKNNCTIEEREEYERYIEKGIVLYAGVNYKKILEQAEKEADIIIWDGGNNDTPFYKPDLYITVTDPLRAEHGFKYYPGQTNEILADVIIINKIDSATKDQIRITKNISKLLNPNAQIISARSKVTVEYPGIIKNKKVLVIEDGPTLTHGGMAIGAGYVAAQKYKSKIIDPKKHAVGSIKQTLNKFKQLKDVVPAMGYSPQQIIDLEKTINNSDAEAIIIGTPIDLNNLIKLNKPSTRVRYSLQENLLLKIIKKKFKI